MKLAFVLLLGCLMVACSSDSQSSEPQPQKAVPVVTSVGEPNGSPASGVIGPAGGKLQSPDGLLTLTVPAGALAADTTLTIQPITNFAPGGIGSAYRLGPEGQTFAAPVTLTHTYSDSDVVGSAAEALGIAFQTSDGHWQWETSSSVDLGAKTTAVSTTHFSDWSMVKGFQLLPSAAKIAVSDSIPLRVVFCYVPEGGFSQKPGVSEEDLVRPGYDCDNTDEEIAQVVTAAKLGSWMVNGVTGGNAASGTITSIGKQSARYDAPTVKPDSSHNPVSVSVQVDLGATQKTLVTASIEVTDQSETYSGTVTVTGPLTKTYLPGAWNVNLSASVKLAATSGSPSFLVVPAESTATIESLDYDANGTHCALEGGATASVASGVLITLPTPPYQFSAVFSFQLVPAAQFYTCTDSSGSHQDASATVQLNVECDTPFLPTPDLSHLEATCTTKPLTTTGGETLQAKIVLNAQ
ncbi:MAG: hypothetical protein R3B13_06090 [Polyangiaceae bacterium]